MPWGIAGSTADARVLWYSSTAPNQEGLPSQQQDIPEIIWDAFRDEDRADIQSAWAKSISYKRVNFVDCVAKRNNLHCRLNFYPTPPETAMVTFSRWSPDSALTEHELDICLKSVGGATDKQIAQALNITTQAIGKLRKSAMEKLNCTTREQLGSYFSVTEGL